eukprot:gene14988-10723_t
MRHPQSYGTWMTRWLWWWSCWWLFSSTTTNTAPPLSVVAETVLTVRGRIDTNHAPVFNCSKILDPLLAKRKACAQQSSTHVDICTVFAEDYHFLIPFVLHHLSLGFHQIHIYNNDMKAYPWYLHPTLLCLSAAELITVVPWPGEHEFLNGLNHCHRARVLESRGLQHGQPRHHLTTASHKSLWMAIFDIDELLVLHHDQCIATFVDKYPDAGQLAINWAMFVPTVPFTPYAIFGDPQYLSPEHRQFIDYDRSLPAASASGSTNASSALPLVILPHDMLFMRMKENFHIKCLARPSCVDKVESPHYMTLFADCPFPKKTQTLSGITFPPAPTSAAAERHVSSYPIAQLNHYWTTSVEDFMRKVHRGRGVKQAGVYRNSGDLPVRSKGPMVKDTVLHRTYGAMYVDWKRTCPECFDLSLIPGHQ